MRFLSRLMTSIGTLLTTVACVKSESAAPGPAATAPEQEDVPKAHSEEPAVSHGEAQDHHHRHDAGYQMDFSEVERFAAHFDDPARDAWQRPLEVIEHMKISPGQSVADIGAGTGYFLSYLSEAVGERGKVLALDVEANMVRYMQERAEKAGLANVTTAKVPPDDPALPAQSIDRALIVNTWHHIGERPAYAAKLARALKPGGVIIIVDFTLESDMGPPKDHRLAPDQVIAELTQGGLQAALVEGEQLPKQYVVRASLGP